MNQIPNIDTHAASIVLSEGTILKKILLKAAANKGDKAIKTRVFAAPAVCTPRVNPIPLKPHIKPLNIIGNPPEKRIGIAFLLLVPKKIIELEIHVKRAL